LANSRNKREERRGLSFTGGDEDTAAARNRGGDAGEIGAQVRVQVRYECKGESVSLSSNLNSNKEIKEGKWKGDHRPESLPLMAGGRSDAIGQ
jgi:hypothetical protein